MLEAIRIWTDPSALDFPWLCRTLRATYWGAGWTDGRIRQAVEHSLIFGAYLQPDHQQIGFARVVTDRATFSSVMDVVVDPQHRRQGVGTALMKAVVAHPCVSGTVCVLDTRDMDPFYERFGFARKKTVMMRNPA